MWKMCQIHSCVVYYYFKLAHLTQKRNLFSYFLVECFSRIVYKSSRTKIHNSNLIFFRSNANKCLKYTTINGVLMWKLKRWKKIYQKYALAFSPSFGLKRKELWNNETKHLTSNLYQEIETNSKIHDGTLSCCVNFYYRRYLMRWGAISNHIINQIYLENDLFKFSFSFL